MFDTEFEHATPDQQQTFKVNGQRSRSQHDNAGENVLNHR